MTMLEYTNVTGFRFAVILDSPSTPLKITKFEVTTPDLMSGCMTGGGTGTLPGGGGSDPVTPSGLGGGMIALIVIAVLVVLAGIGFAMYKTGVLQRTGYSSH